MVGSKKKVVPAKKKKVAPARKTKARTIARDLWLPAPPEDVHALFATSAGYERWFAKTARVEAKKGGRLALTFEGGDAPLEGRFTELVRGKKVAIAFEGPLPTQVSITLSKEAAGTRLQLVQSGFGEGKAWDAHFEAHVKGWPVELAKLFVALKGLGRPGKAITLEQVCAAAPREVWKSLGSAEGLSTWFASGGTLEPRRGGNYALQAGPTPIKGKVLEYDPGKALSLTWSTMPCAEADLPAPTIVTFTLAKDGAGTRVQLVHSGFGDGAGWQGVCDSHEETWRALLGRLAQTLAA